MYSKLPSLIIAFHGCDMNIFEDVVLKQNPLSASKNSYDWLGNGMYFWESSRQRAQEWAEEQASLNKYDNPTVIGAVIDLGYCLNLADSAFIPILELGYEALKNSVENEGKELPTNRIGEDRVLRELDCAVIEKIHDINASNNERSFDSVRGLFIEGSEVYEGSGFKRKTHIQICIRNPNCIKGYFNPLSENPKHVMP